MRRLFYVTALALSLSSCSRKVEEADPFHMHKIDDGKDHHVLAYAGENPATGDKANIFVGCTLPIMRAERQEPDGKSFVATVINGFIYRRKVPTPAKPPLSEREVFYEYVQSLASEKGEIKRTKFDFGNVCDASGTPYDDEIRGGLRGILIAPKGSSLLAFDR